MIESTVNCLETWHTCSLWCNKQVHRGDCLFSSLDRSSTALSFDLQISSFCGDSRSHGICCCQEQLAVETIPVLQLKMIYDSVWFMKYNNKIVTQRYMMIMPDGYQYDQSVEWQNDLYAVNFILIEVSDTWTRDLSSLSWCDSLVSSCCCCQSSCSHYKFCSIISTIASVSWQFVLLFCSGILFFYHMQWSWTDFNFIGDHYRWVKFWHFQLPND